MKNLFLTIVCACMALALMAGEPKPDAAQSMQASKKSCVASQDANGKKAGQSLHQFLRERNLTLNDNRLTKKVPRRDSANGLAGTRIAIMEAQALEDYDWEGNFLLSDTVYSLGWNSNMYYLGCDGEYELYFIDNFYGKYQVPFEYNVETSGVELFSCWIGHDSVSANVGRNRTDTITDTYFYTVDDFFSFSEGETINGEIFNDGSIWFDGGVLIYKEIIVKVFRNNVLSSTETFATVSPILSGLYLLNPNGIHESVVEETQSSSFDPSHFVVNATTFDLSQAYWNVERVVPGPVLPGGSGGGTVQPCGGGGLKDRPIGPRNPNRSSLSPLPQGDNNDTPVDSAAVDSVPDVNMSLVGNSQIITRDISFGDGRVTLGGGGHVPGKPFGPGSPRSSIPGDVINHTLPNGLIGKAATKDGVTTYTMQNPVYMFQVDDSTLFVYNLFGLGSTMNGMFIHEDGTMTLPGQALFYDPVKDDDFCNFSQVGDTLTIGNSGFATPDTISWGKTVPHSLSNSYFMTFDSNRLYFTDGSKFVLPGSFLRGDVNNDGLVKINDVSVLISHLLSDDFEDNFEFNSRNSDTSCDGQLGINDVAVLINYLLSGVWPK